MISEENDNQDRFISQQCQINHFTPKFQQSHNINKESTVCSFKPNRTEVSQKYNICKEDLQHYQFLFASTTRLQSLQRKNQVHEMQNQSTFNNQDEQAYKKRIDKLENLRLKEQYQKQMMSDLKAKDSDKFQIIFKIIRFLSKIKSFVRQLKIQDFSNKTYIALVRSKTNDLKRLLKCIDRIYHFALQKVDDKIQKLIIIKEFLILPRFLISREKIQFFVSCEQSQEQFLYLIKKTCLGHYNNEANKKMPQKQTITLLKSILERDDNQETDEMKEQDTFLRGKEKFKSICVINHGNKYRKDNGDQAYKNLYTKSYSELKQIEKYVKKSVKEGKSNHTSSVRTQKEKTHTTIQEEQAMFNYLNRSQICQGKRKLHSKLSLNEQLNTIPIKKNQKGSKVKKLLSLKEPSIIFSQTSIQNQFSEEESQLNLEYPKEKCKIIENIIIIQPKK